MRQYDALDHSTVGLIKNFHDFYHPHMQYGGNVMFAQVLSFCLSTVGGEVYPVFGLRSLLRPLVSGPFRPLVSGPFSGLWSQVLSGGRGGTPVRCPLPHPHARTRTGGNTSLPPRPGPEHGVLPPSPTGQHTTRTGYTASGTPLAITQENFLIPGALISKFPG